MARRTDADSTFRIGRNKADEDQLQPTMRNTLRNLSRPTNKNCPTADRRLGGKVSSLERLTLTDSSGCGWCCWDSCLDYWPPPDQRRPQQSYEEQGHLQAEKVEHEQRNVNDPEDYVRPSVVEPESY
ncbi:hypothetical protein DPX16_2700 [Anabarilius grahami]|uniref:Uncharacterized protein n=1 Tax=Anabarilius grahami TaxID=495550 RepID=A0A3N0YFG0_ANAGA|nr:hypothetical protein DPX16_2700 [Anabarilius grahami]